jgi:recombinational DNA repair protein RecR
MQQMTSIKPCRRCGQAAAASVCPGCRAQESVARHIPPARRWFAWR